MAAATAVSIQWGGAHYWGVLQATFYINKQNKITFLTHYFTEMCK